MKSFALLLALIFVQYSPSTAFTPLPTIATSKVNMVGLSMARDNEEFMKFARQSRSAGSDDRVVELVRPLGLVLADDGQGNVYVQTIAPKGNAARSGMVRDYLQRLSCQDIIRR